MIPLRIRRAVRIGKREGGGAGTVSVVCSLQMAVVAEERRPSGVRWVE